MGVDGGFGGVQRVDAVERGGDRLARIGCSAHDFLLRLSALVPVALAPGLRASGHRRYYYSHVFGQRPGCLVASAQSCLLASAWSRGSARPASYSAVNAAASRVVWMADRVAA